MAASLAKWLYILNGTIFLLAGVSVLLLGTRYLPEPIRQHIVEAAHGQPHVLHFLQEAGCLLVLAGVLTFWFVRHYQQSWPFHWAMTLFWALFALVHWFDTSGHFHNDGGQWVISIPCGLYVLAGLWRWRTG